MKKFSFLQYTAGILSVCLTFALASCDDDNYKPGEPTAEGAVGAYFDSSNKTSFTLMPEDESIELTVSRNDTKSAVVVPIVATGEAAEVMQVPESLSFEAGEETQTLVIGVKDIELKKEYNLKLAIGESQADHYAVQDGLTSFSCSVSKSQWVKLKENIRFYYYSPYQALPDCYSELWQLEGINRFYFTNFLGTGANMYFTLSGSGINLNDASTLVGEIVPSDGEGATTYDYSSYKLNYIWLGTDNDGYDIWNWSYEDTDVYSLFWYGGYDYSPYSWLDCSQNYIYLYGYVSSSAYEGYMEIYGVWE